MNFLDPIIEEVHEARKRIWQKVGGTKEGYIKYIREQEKKYSDRLVHPKEKNTNKK